MTEQQMSAPLEGILVADFSRVLAGPLTTMWLADLGATVVKVEQPGRGDDTRHWGPPWTATSSSYFTAANRSKSSVTLDFSDADDLAVAQELARRADVFVENFKAGGLARFGLDYDEVSRTNPEVVYASITGFGSAQGASVPGYDFVVQAVGGLMSLTGYPDGDPVKAGVALVDVLTAKDATIGILAALRARERDGVGQHIEVNLLSSLLGSLANQASGYLATGVSPERRGNEHPSIAPYETLRCRSGLLAVACGNDAQFVKLCTVLGVPEVASDERFSTNSARVENRREMVPLLEGRLATEDATHWEKECVRVGVPAGRVGTLEEAFSLAESYGLNPTTALPDPHPAQVAHPIGYSHTRIRSATPPPQLGQHADVVRQWLDSDDSVSDLEKVLRADG